MINRVWCQADYPLRKWRPLTAELIGQVQVLNLLVVSNKWYCCIWVCTCRFSSARGPYFPVGRGRTLISSDKPAVLQTIVDKLTADKVRSVFQYPNWSYQLSNLCQGTTYFCRMFMAGSKKVSTGLTDNNKLHCTPLQSLVSILCWRADWKRNNLVAKLKRNRRLTT